VQATMVRHMSEGMVARYKERATTVMIRNNMYEIRCLTRVNSTNILDEGLRIGGRGRRMNSKVKISQTRCVLRISMVLNWLNLNLSLAGLSWALYIGGQVSRNRSGSIQITASQYVTDLYFDYDYAWAWLNGAQGYTDNGLY
jgi:hypothetical protein